MKKVHDEIENDDTVVRLSIYTKDRVKIGNFSRGEKNRAEVEAADYDFGDKFLVLFGIMNVKDGTVDLSIAETKVTADFMVDRLEEYWNVHDFQDSKKVLVLNADNGPENHSRRTQFIKRMVEFAVKYDINIHLAYYPPYHSKYNPIERVWGALEQHWNGDLLDDTETVIGFAKSMKYKGQHLNVDQQFCIDYVVLHELIHFKYRNHDREFYNFMTSLMPDWKQRKEILDEEVVREL